MLFNLYRALLEAKAHIRVFTKLWELIWGAGLTSAAIVSVHIVVPLQTNKKPPISLAKEARLLVHILVSTTCIHNSLTFGHWFNILECFGFKIATDKCIRCHLVHLGRACFLARSGMSLPTFYLLVRTCFQAKAIWELGAFSNFLLSSTLSQHGLAQDMSTSMYFTIFAVPCEATSCARSCLRLNVTLS